MKSSIFILITLVLSTLLSCSPLNPPNSIDINLNFKKGDVLVKADDTDPTSLVPELIIEKSTTRGGSLTFKVNPIGKGTEELPIDTYNIEETANDIITALRLILKDDNNTGGQITLIPPIFTIDGDSVIIVIADKAGVPLKDGSVKYTVTINEFQDIYSKWSII